MPQPKIETGNAEQHRNPDPDPDEEEQEQVDPGDVDLDQTSSSGSLSFLTNKKVILGLVAVGALLLYLKYVRSQASGSGNSQRRQTVEDPSEIADSLEEQEGFQPRQDREDPLVADEDVIRQSGVFPSLSEGAS